MSDFLSIATTSSGREHLQVRANLQKIIDRMNRSKLLKTTDFSKEVICCKNCFLTDSGNAENSGDVKTEFSNYPMAFVELRQYDAPAKLLGDKVSFLKEVAIDFTCVNNDWHNTSIMLSVKELSPEQLKLSENIFQTQQKKEEEI